MLVLINGCQGSGKSSTAGGLQTTLEASGIPVKRYNFAKVLYEMHDAVRPVLIKYGIQRPVIDGPLLQVLGTEYGRNILGEDVWVNCAKKWLAEQEAQPELSGNTIYIIDDCRFPNEFDAFPEALKFRLEAPEEVRKARRGDKWRDNTNHPSEISLDSYRDKFDMVLDTSVAPLHVVVQTLRGAIDARIAKRSGT